MARRTPDSVCPSCNKTFFISPEGYLDSYRHRWFCSKECADNPPKRVICEDIEELKARREQLAQQIDILQKQMENIEGRIDNLTPPRPQTPSQKTSSDYLKKKIMEQSIALPRECKICGHQMLTVHRNVCVVAYECHRCRMIIEEQI